MTLNDTISQPTPQLQPTQPQIPFLQNIVVMPYNELVTLNDTIFQPTYQQYPQQPLPPFLQPVTSSIPSNPIPALIPWLASSIGQPTFPVGVQQPAAPFIQPIVVVVTSHVKLQGFGHGWSWAI